MTTTEPEVQYCCKQLNDLVIDDPDAGTARLQPCKSPVWDTAIAMRALGGQRRGGRTARRVRGAVGWLLEKQTRRRGDWAETVDAAPGGWYFEYANEFYPDCDDTAMVAHGLANAVRPAGAAIAGTAAGVGQ